MISKEWKKHVEDVEKQKAVVLDWLRRSTDIETMALRKFAADWIGLERSRVEIYRQRLWDLRRDLTAIHEMVKKYDGEMIVKRVENAVQQKRGRTGV